MTPKMSPINGDTKKMVREEIYRLLAKYALFGQRSSKSPRF